jgi:hypothetical protein
MVFLFDENPDVASARLALATGFRALRLSG